MTYFNEYTKYKKKYLDLKAQKGGADTNTDIKEKSLYERLGGIYAIAAVVDKFSDALIINPVVGKNSSNEFLRDWSNNKLNRLAGLKWLRTLWMADITGGPYKYVATVAGKCPLSLENAHKKFQISPTEFDAVAEELAKTLDSFSVPEKEKKEVLGAFAAHKPEVNTGFFIASGTQVPPPSCPFHKP